VLVLYHPTVWLSLPQPYLDLDLCCISIAQPAPPPTAAHTDREGLNIFFPFPLASIKLTYILSALLYRSSSRGAISRLAIAPRPYFSSEKEGLLASVSPAFVSRVNGSPSQCGPDSMEKKKGKDHPRSSSPFSSSFSCCYNRNEETIA
jgi:hypothetical protein